MRYGTGVKEILETAELPSIVFKGRVFTASELRLIRKLVSTFPGLSRQELANTACEWLEWRRPKGGLKTLECKQLLSKVESEGYLKLPVLRATKPRGARTSVPRTQQGEPQEPLTGTVRDVAPVTLKRVQQAEDRRLWRELIGRYHYLGHKVAFGAHLRYLIEVAQPSPRVVGCLQLSSPAWKMARRDRWIGWSESVRERHLQKIVNNSRFLLLPWVEVRNLASYVLGQMARQLPQDWQRAYGVQPLLLETLVEEGRFAGTCYRAANWIDVGLTQGRGRMDREHQRHGACRKRIFLYPLVARARAALRGEV